MTLLPFFGSFIGLIILALVVGYMLEYQGISNAIYVVLVFYAGYIHAIIFGN